MVRSIKLRWTSGVESVAEHLLDHRDGQIADLLAQRLGGLADLGVDVGAGPGR